MMMCDLAFTADTLSLSESNDALEVWLVSAHAVIDLLLSKVSLLRISGIGHPLL